MIRVGPNTNLSAIDVEALQSAPGSSVLEVDVNRTDLYVADGSALRPFKDLYDAMVVANTLATASRPYHVVVAPGIYVVRPFSIAQHVKLSGSGRNQTRLTAQDVTAHFITLAQGSRLDGCTIYGPTDPNVAGVYAGVGGTDTIRLADVAFSRGYYGMLFDTTDTTHIVLENVVFADIGETMAEMLRVTGKSHVFFSDSRIEADDNHVEIGAEVTGANARLTVVDLYHQVFGTSTVGLRVNNDATLRVNGSVFMGGHTALQLGADGAPNLRAVGAIIHRALGVPSNYTHDIEVGTVNASVVFGGFASRDKFVNTVGASFYANFVNHEPGYEGACCLGELVVGDTDDAMPLLDYGKSAYLTGLVSGGDVELGAGLNVIVRAGVGYINDPALCSPIRVAWNEDLHFALTDNAEQYIYIDNTGAICKSTLSIDYNTNVILAKAQTASGAVVVLTQDEVGISHTASRLADFFEHVIGPITASGCNVTKTGGNSYKISINGGTFLVGLSERDITGAAGAAFTYVWQSAPGVWTYNAATIIDKDHYDNGTGPTDFGGNDWKKEAVYLIKNGGGEQYFVVMGQAAFVDQAAALAGALPTAPDLLTEYGLRVAAIVTHAEAADIDTVVDIRPFLGPNAPVATTTPTNHNDTLLRDRDDNHMQYHTDARAVTWLAAQPGNTTNLVTDGDDHNHDGVTGGAQISHADLGDIGTTTHADLDLFVGSKAAASGLASLNGSSKVVQDPANATATPTAGKIPIANGGGSLAAWVPADAVAGTASLRKLGTGATDACAGNDARLSDPRAPSAHQASHVSGADQIAEATTGVHGLLAAADKLKLDGIAAGATVASVAGTAPIVSSGGATPTISIAAATTGAAGSMSAADKLKLDGVAAGATVNVFGNNYQYAEDLARTTHTGDTAWVNKVSLTTPVGLTGTFRVGWQSVVDMSATNQNVELRIIDVGTGLAVGATQIYRPGNATGRFWGGGAFPVVLAGMAKVWAVQYRTASAGAEAGSQDARIEFWRLT